ncbi:MAG TPA: ATP-binding protein [Streptosporangiaceae bacterium]|nr:ATP-binding protein [Streptosporangiaceae bacterium]
MSGDEARAADAWPLRSSLALGAFPSAVSCARLHTRQVIWEWGLKELSEVVELVVSELVTNAVKASAATAADRDPGEPGAPPFVRLLLFGSDREALVQVWDGSPALPVRNAPDLAAISGRGLMLVEAVSARWGYHHVSPSAGPAPPGPRGQPGKVVWALVADPLP